MLLHKHAQHDMLKWIFIWSGNEIETSCDSEFRNIMKGHRVLALQPHRIHELIYLRTCTDTDSIILIEISCRISSINLSNNWILKITLFPRINLITSHNIFHLSQATCKWSLLISVQRTVDSLSFMSRRKTNEPITLIWICDYLTADNFSLSLAIFITLIYVRSHANYGNATKPSQSTKFLSWIHVSHRFLILWAFLFAAFGAHIVNSVKNQVWIACSWA